MFPCYEPALVTHQHLLKTVETAHCFVFIFILEFFTVFAMFSLCKKFNKIVIVMDEAIKLRLFVNLQCWVMLRGGSGRVQFRL